MSMTHVSTPPAGIGDGEGQQALKDAVLAATSKLDPASDFGPDTWVPQTYDAVWAASIASSRAIAGDGGLGARAIQALRSNAIEPFQSATVRNRTWDSNADPVMGSVRMLIHSYNKQPGSEVAQRHLVATVDGNEFNFSGTAKLVWADGTIYPQVV